MPRKARFFVSDGVYHILSRGHNRRKVFYDNRDFLKFTKILQLEKSKRGWQIYNYGFMGNHVHMIIMSPQGIDLSNGMKNLNQTYAQYFRKRYGGIGYIWQNRFKSFIIQNGIYLLRCGRYVELNPVNAGIVRNPEGYKWSSYRFYAFGEDDPLLTFNPEYLALADNFEDRQSAYMKFVSEGQGEKRTLDRYFKSGAWGDEDFVKEMKAKGLKSVSWKIGRPKKCADK